MPAPAHRFEWIDFLRGIAVVIMIWTHTANTFLPMTVQVTPFYHTLGYYHGLVAPTFFWLAGYMRGTAAARPGPRRSAWPTVKRLLMIWAIAYLLHLPWWSLFQGDFSPETLRILFQSDVLHCLAVSSLLLLAIERLTGPSRAQVPWICAGLVGAAMVRLTDTMADVTTGFMPLDAYLSKDHGSLFPLFPWVGFACAGFISGGGGLPGWGTAACGAVFALILPQVRGGSSTTQFFLERLGWVLMAAAGCAHAARWISHAPRWMLLAGRESLCLYVVHLLIIYAVPWWQGKPLSVLIGPSQSWTGVVLWFVVILSLSLAAAWLNEKRTRRAIAA